MTQGGQERDGYRPWDREEISRYTINAFGDRIRSGRADVRMSKSGEVVISTDAGGRPMSRAVRFHGDPRFRGSRGEGWARYESMCRGGDG